MTKVSAFYNGCVTREFTAVIEKKGRWYVAWVEEIPGVNTQGKTLTEARRNSRMRSGWSWKRTGASLPNLPPIHDAKSSL
jgi:hypothetical protein